MSEHLGMDGQPGPISMPRWTHGQCIGPECARWKETNAGPICGKALIDLAAGLALATVGPEEIATEYARWALPEEDDEESEEEEPDGTE